MIGITQVPSTREYYLVFYHDIHSLLDGFIQLNINDKRVNIKYIQYGDFDEIKKIGSGGYGTVYIAKYKGELKWPITMQQTVVLKRFKSFDETPELFISEVSNC